MQIPISISINCCEFKKDQANRSLVFSGTVHWFVGRQAFIHYCGLHHDEVHSSG